MYNGINISFVSSYFGKLHYLLARTIGFKLIQAYTCIFLNVYWKCPSWRNGLCTTKFLHGAIFTWFETCLFHLCFNQFGISYKMLKHVSANKYRIYFLITFVSTLLLRGRFLKALHNKTYQVLPCFTNVVSVG